MKLTFISSDTDKSIKSHVTAAKEARENRLCCTPFNFYML